VLNPPCLLALSSSEGLPLRASRGTLGDVTILSGDVLDVTPDEIRAMEVIATIVDGIVVYCSDTKVCAGG
jgi:hypothetical protein